MAVVWGIEKYLRKTFSCRQMSRDRNIATSVIRGLEFGFLDSMYVFWNQLDWEMFFVGDFVAFCFVVPIR